MMNGSDEPAISFEAVLERIPGPTTYIHIIQFPDSVEELFGMQGAVRVKGTLNGVPIERSLLPRSDGTHLLVISKEQRRAAGVEAGDTAAVELWLNESDAEPELPEELEAALDIDEKAREEFGRRTLAMRRDIAAYVGSAKRPETRERRAVEVSVRLAAGRRPFSDGKKP